MWTRMLGNTMVLRKQANEDIDLISDDIRCDDRCTDIMSSHYVQHGSQNLGDASGFLRRAI
jgi:hypothetical protein